jgi:glycosyltransferase involved in cell wall biosynthesis
MKLAFYYHITIAKRQDGNWTPSYQGVFIDALASKVETLYLLMHMAGGTDEGEADYRLKGENIIWVNLGLKTPAWHRDIFYKSILTEKLKEIKGVEYVLVRAPSPLAPYFKRYLPNSTLSLLIVGDYAESVEQTKPRSLREWVINRYLTYNDWRLRLAMKSTDVIVNSPALLQKYQSKTKSINLIKTTTLSENDFFYKQDTCTGGDIKLLYTGRIDPLKGLFELVEALSILRGKKINVSLYIVGWEPKNEKIVENELIEFAKKMRVQEFLFFPGRKPVGSELNAMYRMADIYCIPSYEEGFPKTIWEALANSLPVISTLVGGIPEYLINGEEAILIEPKKVDELHYAIKQVIENKSLREKLISNGIKKAKEVTLEFQTNMLLEFIKKNG